MADEMDKSKVPEGRVPEDRNSAPDNEAEQAAQATDHEGEGAAGVSAVPQDPDELTPDLSAASAVEATSSAAGSANAVQSSAEKHTEPYPGPAARPDSATASPRAAAARPAPAGSTSNRAAVNDLAMPGLDLLYDVELDATLQFGSKEMLLRDVLELGPGDVVELDRHIAEPVDLVVGDRIVARGEVVVASGNFALRVTEVATPQMRLESIRCLF